MNTIISTHPFNIHYTKVTKDLEQHTITREWDILIKGGAGTALGKAGKVDVPNGVPTEVSDEILEMLEELPAFKKDQEAGLIRVLRGRKQRMVDVDEEAKTMAKGASRSISEQDLIDAGANVGEDGNIGIEGDGKTNVAKKILADRDEAKAPALPTKKVGKTKKTTK